MTESMGAETPPHPPLSPHFVGARAKELDADLPSILGGGAPQPVFRLSFRPLSPCPYCFFVVPEDEPVDSFAVP